jgi:predicted Rossmann fold nucleotide-binding protein DprA/Smf involved in DNA uptake
METRGAIISEFTMGTFPGPQNFPICNRLIAGMSPGVVVVEGAQYSGSLITARLAMEFGREVYGVPGRREFGSGRADLVQSSYTRRILPRGPAGRTF